MRPAKFLPLGSTLHIEQDIPSEIGIDEILWISKTSHYQGVSEHPLVRAAIKAQDGAAYVVTARPVPITWIVRNRFAATGRPKNVDSLEIGWNFALLSGKPGEKNFHIAKKLDLI